MGFDQWLAGWLAGTIKGGFAEELASVFQPDAQFENVAGFDAQN